MHVLNSQISWSANLISRFYRCGFSRIRVKSRPGFINTACVLYPACPVHRRSRWRGQTSSTATTSSWFRAKARDCGLIVVGPPLTWRGRNAAPFISTHVTHRRSFPIWKAIFVECLHTSRARMHWVFTGVGEEIRMNSFIYTRDKDILL
jgi:hypothetical protein